jgi:WD40 repeat protein
MLAVAFGAGADGRPLLASGGVDGTVRLWDPATGDPVGNPLPGHRAARAVVFGAGADGRPLLASGGIDGTVRWWDLATGDPVGNVMGLPAGIVGKVWLTFCTDADGRPLLASVREYNDAIQVWDLATGELVASPHTGLVVSAAFGVGADGRPLMATGEIDGLGTDEHVWMVRLRDPATGDPVGDPRLDPGAASALAFGTSADGRLLLASGGIDGTVRWWDLATGGLVGDPRHHTSGVRALAFGASAGGRPLLASVSEDATMRLWDSATGAFIGTLRRRMRPEAIATQNTQLAIADREGITVVEITDG